MRRSAKIACPWPCHFPVVSGQRPPEHQQIAGRLPAGHAQGARNSDRLHRRPVPPIFRSPFQSSLMTLSASPKRRAERRGDLPMATAPLMPKATAVWLVENTSLSFDQIAQLCNLHPLEVKAIADGDAAQGIKGLDPILTGQLTREEISAAEADPNHKLHIADPKVRLPEAKPKKGPRYTPVSRRQDRPNAILWLVRNHAAGRHHQVDHFGDPRPHPLELDQSDAARSGDARAVLTDRSRHRSAEGGQGKAGADRGPGRDAAARVGHHGAEGRARARRTSSGEEVRRSRCQRRVRQAQAAWWEERVTSFRGARSANPESITTADTVLHQS